MDHMILAAADLGVGTCWIAAFDEKRLVQVLGLKENEKVFAITPLGYPPTGYKPHQKVRLTMEEAVSFV
jgi:nitroreductase